MSSSLFRLIRTGISMVLLAAPAAHADDLSSYIKVSLDHARILKLDRAVSKVIIGSDQIADATVADTKTIVLTGRSFGTTNLVLLDAQGNAIVDEKLLVTLEEENTVRVYKQSDRAVLFCSTSCEPMNMGGPAASPGAPG